MCRLYMYISTTVRLFAYYHWSSHVRKFALQQTLPNVLRLRCHFKIMLRLFPSLAIAFQSVLVLLFCRVRHKSMDRNSRGWCASMFSLAAGVGFVSLLSVTHRSIFATSLSDAWCSLFTVASLPSIVLHPYLGVAIMLPEPARCVPDRSILWSERRSRE